MTRIGVSLRRTYWAAIVLAGLLSPSAAAIGQETAAGEPAATSAGQTEAVAAQMPESVAAVQEESAGAGSTTDTQEIADDEATTPADQTDGAATQTPGPAAAVQDESAETESPTGTQETADAESTSDSTEPESDASGWRPYLPYLTGALVIALIVLPVLLGNWLAQQWKMPDHGWKFSLTSFLLASSLVIITVGALNDGFKFGPDLAGGITLIYELADASNVVSEEGGPVSQGQVKMDTLIGQLKQRVDPTSTREVTIRAYGKSAVEIIIPAQGGEALTYIKRRITELGQLEFRITADETRAEDKLLIDQARLLPPSQKDVSTGGKKVAEWVEYSEEEFGGPQEPDNRGIVKRMAGDTPEALVLIDLWNVTGESLRSVSKGFDDRGAPAVNFSFDARGAARFRQLTSQNKPNPATPGRFHYLGIVLDKRLISAPSIKETISSSGQISGGGMNDTEVEFIVGILDAGTLSARLNKTPVRESVISPTLGKVTVEKGETAIVVSLAAVVLFMLVYYRFAGIVACMALTFNLLLVLALMVLIKAAFTLPGLAGLVLTVGMSVDANVLIYERIREELRAGAALRMAVRNGFGRAMSAIIDSNVTTIITGVVLYRLGTDQIKGFSVTLILGILTSMFTAIFFARLVFDVAERRGWVKTVRMMHIFTQPNYDFLRGRYLAAAASLVLVAIGLAAVVGRGTQLLDIDFTGGSSVTFTLRQDQKIPLEQVEAALLDSPLRDKNLLVVEHGEGQTDYGIDSSEESVDAVKRILVDKFGRKLMTYSVKIGDLTPTTEGEFSGTATTLAINVGEEFGSDEGIEHDALADRIRKVMEASGHGGIQPTVENPNYRRGSAVRFNEWTVRLTGLDQDAARGVFEQLKTEMESEPLFPLASIIGGRVSGNMQTQALLAIFVSILGVTGYLWLRFQKVTYGLAATAALVHDVLVTVGLLALSGYIVKWAPALAAAVQIDSFQISLTIVAALLTIMGYSLNDTIVTFDRLREIKGKSPQLTSAMVNLSVNQTLSRTLLTSLTSLMVVAILYFFGGDGIHNFAFAYLVGVIAGTYSTIFIASPVLLWLSGASMSMAEGEDGARAVERAG